MDLLFLTDVKFNTYRRLSMGLDMDVLVSGLH